MDTKIAVEPLWQDLLASTNPLDHLIDVCNRFKTPRGLLSASVASEGSTLTVCYEKVL